MASAEDIEKFKKNVTEFNIARWDRDYLESAHCFYSGNDSIVDKIIFAQDAWGPEDNARWTWVKYKSKAECYSMNSMNCSFLS